MVKKIVGVYDTEDEVIEVVNDLEFAGYRPEDITLIARNSDGSSWLWEDANYDTTTADDVTVRVDRHEEDESFWDKVKNLFMGEANEFDEVDGFRARFQHYGLSETEAERYNAEVQRGRIVVLAPEDYELRMDNARMSDDQTTSMDSARMSNDPTLSMDREQMINNWNEDVGRDTERKMKLREEELDIDKREVSAGEVEVRKEVHEDIERVDVPVSREEVYVERKPVYEEDTLGNTADMEDETIRIPLKEEEIEVRKRPIVKEEVEIGKKHVQDTEEVYDTVKREELDVDMENNKDKSQQSRELDAVYMEDDERDDKLARRSKREWNIDQEDDRL